MTKEEFNKQTKRYFDSINPERGEVTDDASCSGVGCSVCVFNHGYGGCCGPSSIFEVMEKFEKWVKEHPQITNKDKMEQVFGIKIDPKHVCPPGKEMCGSSTCEECRKWWNKEYKEPNGEATE